MPRCTAARHVRLRSCAQLALRKGQFKAKKEEFKAAASADLEESKTQKARQR